jgi:hypothetical protein
MKQVTFMTVFFWALAFSATPASAQNRPLVCAENEVTSASMCFHKDKVRANGQVRATPFYKGGPKGADDTGFTARVHCGSKALELTDRQGVAFVRNVPTEKVGRDFVRFLCEHQKVKQDSNLATN